MGSSVELPIAEKRKQKTVDVHYALIPSVAGKARCRVIELGTKHKNRGVKCVRLYDLARALQDLELGEKLIMLKKKDERKWKERRAAIQRLNWKVGGTL